MAISIGKVAPKIRVLVAEDSLSDMILIQKAFEQSKRQVQIFRTKDGQETIDYLKGVGRFQNAARPDLILLDLNMPKKSGLEVLSEIKTDPKLENIAVIVLTNSNLENDLISAYDAHANFYIVKPHDLEELFVAMRHVADIWLKGSGPEKGEKE